MPSRRTVIKSIAQIPLAGIPLAAILADPRLARAAAETTKLVRINAADGREVAGALAIPAKTPAPAVLLVHEWWGLNDQIKAMANEFANQGYLALAVDLFDGRLAESPDDARALTQKVKVEEAAATLKAWVEWLKNHPQGTRKVASVGWCFGGGWALNAATVAPADATVVYYGRVNLPASQLANLKGPVLGHFATQDQFINRDMVAAFEKEMQAAGKPFTVHWYEANHAFANPTGSNYDKEDTQVAWQRTLDFLKKELG